MPGQWPYFTFQSISKHPKLDFVPLTNLNFQANPFHVRQNKESDPSSAAYYWKGPDISLHPLESNWRGGERPGAVLVHVLFSASGDFCCAFSCLSISQKIWKLLLQLWPRRSSQCSVTHQHQTDLVMNEREFWALGQGCWGCFAALWACLAVGDWALSGLLVATKSVISHCVGPGNLLTISGPPLVWWNFDLMRETSAWVISI